MDVVHGFAEPRIDEADNKYLGAGVCQRNFYTKLEIHELYALEHSLVNFDHTVGHV